MAVSVASIGIAAVVAAYGAQGASADGSAAGVSADGGSRTTLHFTSKLDTFHAVDVAPEGPSAGDQYYIGSHFSGDVRGRTAASCVWTTLYRGGLRQCDIDFRTKRGLITTHGVINRKRDKVRLVVTGGRHAFTGAQGRGTLTPSATGSDVVLRLR